MLSKIGCFLTVLFVTSATQAYTKVGIGYILSQPERVKSTPVQPLYYQEQDKYSYSFDYGYKHGNWDYGIGLNGLINQGKSSKNHKPYNLEIFADYNLPLQHDMVVVIGAGVKLITNEEITRDNGKVYVFSEEDNLRNRLSARIGILKNVGNWQVGVMHRSQWLIGRPFDDNWEYHKTELVLHYQFD